MPGKVLMALCVVLAAVWNLSAAPYHGSLYTPVKAGEAIGPIPAEPLAYYPYEPRQVSRLKDLPADLRTKALAAIHARVGDDFSKRLRFVGGEAVNLGELHRLNPDSRKFRVEVPAYELHWEFVQPEVGIRNYTVTLALRRDGSVLQGPDLPAFAVHANQLQLVPLKRVAKDLVARKLIDPASTTATITYDQKLDHLIWHFEQPLPGTGSEVQIRTVDVDAHTGVILRRS